MVLLPRVKLEGADLSKLKDDTFTFPVAAVSKFKKRQDKKSNTSVELTMRDGRKVKVHFPSDGNTSGVLRFIEIWERLLNPLSLGEFFAFSLYEHDPSLELTYNGWSAYNLRNEFKRQGLDFPEPIGSPGLRVDDGPYKIVSNLRTEGPLCDTYPDEVVVPTAITYNELQACAKFRSRKRFPVLVYCYKQNNRIRATLWRSAQCKVC